jgi:cell division protein FtsN
MAKKPAQAFRGGERKLWPAWAWLGIGVLLGLALSALVLMRDWVPALRHADVPQPNPEASAPRTGDAGVAAEPDDAAPRPKYDFYSVLPEMEVVIPEAEIEAQARAPETQPAAQRLFLQAGSFRSAPDAEGMKARLALLGLRAQVVAVTVNGTQWHRIRVGPYASARELDDARRALTSNGIQSIALRETGE